ncbi:flavoprotein [Marinisporobacter balticus]|uniref:Flavoprotein n=1 Tax=Marinisporobacter balticus TaxID=2018667 RepID=A0A4R2KNH6_9FIRM|nr:flavoprotein [Marinisporobacter balticus]TCO75263.1 flavoprotein [Marinisporobacter balticus]
MKDNFLVKEILNNIASNIVTRQSVQMKNRQGSVGLVNKTKNILVVLTGSNNGIDEILNHLNQLKRYGYCLNIVLSKTAENIIGLDRLKKELYSVSISLEENKEQYLDLIEKSHLVLVPLLTQNTAAKLRAGIQDTMASLCIWQALWQEKMVLADTRGLVCNGKDTKNAILNQIVEDNLSFLKKMGLKILDRKSYLVAIDTILRHEDKTLCQENQSKDVEKKEQIDILAINEEEAKRKIITQKDIYAMVGKMNQLHIHKHTIITPLARDYAKEKNIELIRNT